MKTDRKIFLDRFVGNPAGILLNFVVRMVGFCLNIDHSLDKPLKTIVVSKYLGMGSIIQATPLLQTLREKFPQTKIIFVTTHGNKVLLEHIPSVDEILTINDKNFYTLFRTVTKLLFDLWKRKVDVFIDLEIHSNFSILITTFSLATNRMGFFKNDEKYKKGIFTHMMYFNYKASISQAYLQFARLLGCEKITNSLDSISLTEPEEIASEKLFFQQNIVEGKYIVINPNTSDLCLERRWPAKNFVRLIEKVIVQFPDYKVVLIGAKNEMEYVHSISVTCKSENVIDTSGKLNLVNLIWLIKNASLLVTNDTGPMHIGFAVGTKIVGLFGPCSPVQYGSPGNSHLIYKNLYCSPCVHEFLIPPCKGNNQCMKLISVEEVWEVVKSFQHGMPSEKPVGAIIYESEIILGQVLRA